jgi:hypothetical protein
MGSILEISWPDNIQNFMDGFDWINVDLLRVSSVDCIRGEVVNFYEQFLVVVFVPFAIIVIMPVLVYYVMFYARKIISKKSTTSTVLIDMSIKVYSH